MWIIAIGGEDGERFLRSKEQGRGASDLMQGQEEVRVDEPSEMPSGFMDLQTEAVLQMLTEEGFIGLYPWCMIHSAWIPGQPMTNQAAFGQLTFPNVSCPKPKDLYLFDLLAQTSLSHPPTWLIQKLSQKHIEGEDGTLCKSYLIPNTAVEPAGSGLCSFLAFSSTLCSILYF